MDGILEYLRMSPRQEEILVRIVDTYKRSLTALNEYAGNIGDKLVLTLTTQRVFPMETYYGTSYMIILTDDLGRTFKYFGTSKAIPDVGESAKLKFTVSEQNIYNGTKQTSIQRPSISK